MSEDEQKEIPHRNVITRALGMKDTVQVDISSADVKDGDIFLLCSDGLSGMVDPPTMPRICSRWGLTWLTPAQKLVEAATTPAAPTTSRCCCWSVGRASESLPQTTEATTADDPGR